MANEEHLKILKQGVDVWNQWRRDNPDVRPHLAGAILHGTNLSSANLTYTHLGFTDLSHADLSFTILQIADLRHANLNQTNLSFADLGGATLLQCNMAYADLSAANLNGAILRDTNLNRAICGTTAFANVDLSTVKGLETIQHEGPSTIGIDTVLRSGKLPEQFLRGCGLPKEVVENLPYIVDIPAIEYYSCFISYSTADEDFARLLKDTLYGAGINCWFAPEQILPGQGIDAEIEYGIRYWDKVLFCCSESSLTEKWWVDFEKDKALKKERDLQRQRGQKVGVLIPLNLDGYLFSDKFDTHEHRSIFEMRLAADFVGWKNDMDKFNREVQKVIRALRTDGGRTPPPKGKL